VSAFRKECDWQLIPGIDEVERTWVRSFCSIRQPGGPLSFRKVSGDVATFATYWPDVPNYTANLAADLWLSRIWTCGNSEASEGGPLDRPNT
jgi:hypothetical protein